MAENDKKDNNQTEEDYKDYFWVKVLVIAIVIMWLSLAAGTWVGNYLTEHKIIPTKEDTVISTEQKPKVWKTIVEVDEKGDVSKTAKLENPEENLNIDDFRNIDDPIPGLDDRSTKTPRPSDIKIVQEPVKQEPPPLPGATDNRTEEPKPTETTSAEPSQGSQVDSSKENKTNPTENPTPKPTVSAEPKTAENNESYNIQMGSFANQENANKMIEDLKNKGHNATIEKVVSGDKEFYKVKINGSSQKDAKNKADELKKEGFDAIVTPN